MSKIRWILVVAIVYRHCVVKIGTQEYIKIVYELSFHVSFKHPLTCFCRHYMVKLEHISLNF